LIRNPQRRAIPFEAWIPDQVRDDKPFLMRRSRTLVIADSIRNPQRRAIPLEA
jgi:hypothetical protein